jgi:hypothetical protein
MKQLRRRFLNWLWLWIPIAVLAVWFGIPAMRIHYYDNKVRELCASVELPRLHGRLMT